MRFSESAKELLQKLDWPGNVRELQNLIECIVQLYPGDIILPEYILDNTSQRCYTPSEPSAPAAVPAVSPAPAAPQSAPLLGSRRKKITKEAILEALAACGNNRTEASRYLGVSRRTFYRKLEEFGIGE